MVEVLYEFCEHVFFRESVLDFICDLPIHRKCPYVGVNDKRLCPDFVVKEESNEQT